MVAAKRKTTKAKSTPKSTPRRKKATVTKITEGQLIKLQAVADAGDRQRAYIQSVAGTSTADELHKLAELKDKGVITDAEFETQKARLLS